MTEISIKGMKNHCTKILEKMGASEEIISFYSDALQCEYDISHTIYKLQSKLKNDLDASDTISPNLIFALLQTMTKHFHSWKTTVDRLAKQGTDLPRIHLDEQNVNNLKMITAVCSMNTNELQMTEGEEVQITDASNPNWLKVKNLQGEEGFLPTLSCLIPTPDNDAFTTVERLQVLLLASWTECIRQLRPILTSSACLSSKQINKLWITFSCGRTFRRKDRLHSRLKRLMECSSRSNATLDLNKLHSHLSKLENDLLNLSTNYGGSSETEMNVILRSTEGLDRAVLCYQSFFSQWAKFRKGLSASSRPIRIVEHWEELRRAARFKHFKYYELKMTLTEVDMQEEILYINSHTGEAYTSECKKKRQKVMAEELKTTSHEEVKRFLIKGVVDPRNGNHVSFKYAIDSGILEAKTGLYVNPDTKEALPIERALLEKRVILEYSSVMKSSQRTKTTPLLTLTKRTDFNYRIKGAIDATTAEQVDMDEAERRGLIDSSGNYINPTEGCQLSEKEAVEEGWILADFDNSTPRYESETHEVVEVFDRLLGYFLPHKQALVRGLLNPVSGNYIDSYTGDVVYSVDAISMGLIKTRRRQELFD